MFLLWLQYVFVVVGVACVPSTLRKMCVRVYRYFHSAGFFRFFLTTRAYRFDLKSKFDAPVVLRHRNDVGTHIERLVWDFICPRVGFLKGEWPIIQPRSKPLDGLAGPEKWHRQTNLKNYKLLDRARHYHPIIMDRPRSSTRGCCDAANWERCFWTFTFF